MQSVSQPFLPLCHLTSGAWRYSNLCVSHLFLSASFIYVLALTPLPLSALLWLFTRRVWCSLPHICFHLSEAHCSIQDSSFPPSLFFLCPLLYLFSFPVSNAPIVLSMFLLSTAIFICFAFLLFFLSSLLFGSRFIFNLISLPLLFLHLSHFLFSCLPQTFYPFIPFLSFLLLLYSLLLNFFSFFIVSSLLSLPFGPAPLSFLPRLALPFPPLLCAVMCSDCFFSTHAHLFLSSLGFLSSWGLLSSLALFFPLPSVQALCSNHFSWQFLSSSLLMSLPAWSPSLYSFICGDMPCPSLCHLPSFCFSASFYPLSPPLSHIICT